MPEQTIDVNDIKRAELAIIKSVQQKAFPIKIAAPDSTNNEYVVKKASPLFKLCPFIDDNGILRVGGRLEKVDYSDEVKNLIILLRAGYVSLLIARHYHEIYHQGRGITIKKIRQAGYWICGVRRVGSSVIKSCITCRKCRRPLERQKMAPLPDDHVEVTLSFMYCDVDYFGPFYIRQRRLEVSRYGVIFACLMSRAIHLQVADTLDTNSFSNALRRFIAMRGPIRQLRCDRRTNFVRAKNELTPEYKARDQNRIKQFLQD